MIALMAKVIIPINDINRAISAINCLKKTITKAIKAAMLPNNPVVLNQSGIKLNPFKNSDSDFPKG